MFAFDVDFDEDGNGKKSLLEVFIRYNNDGSHYYYCVINDQREYAFARRDDGVWVDMKTGPSPLATTIGSIIEKELSIDHRFHSH